MRASLSPRNGARLPAHREELVRAAEGTGGTLALLTWTVFGAAVVGRYLLPLRLDVVAYAVLSLTVIRMLPVYLIGCKRILGLTDNALRPFERMEMAGLHNS